MTTSEIQHQIDKVRWQLIEIFKAALKDQVTPLQIYREEGDFFVDKNGQCPQDEIAARFHSPEPWDEMSWEYLACVADHLAAPR